VGAAGSRSRVGRRCGVSRGPLGRRGGRSRAFGVAVGSRVAVEAVARSASRWARSCVGRRGGRGRAFGVAVGAVAVGFPAVCVRRRGGCRVRPWASRKRRGAVDL